uniref:Uncharacterized protein n=1 Tax=Aegilops tauschii subsp. strangulata TaxID=200361 RepID=A0A453KMR1_AEGTS
MFLSSVEARKPSCASPKALLQSSTASPPRSRILMGCAGSTPKGAAAAGGGKISRSELPAPQISPPVLRFLLDPPR